MFKPAKVRTVPALGSLNTASQAYDQMYQQVSRPPDGRNNSGVINYCDTALSPRWHPVTRSADRA
jgi:hypothetical protein